MQVTTIGLDIAKNVALSDAFGMSAKRSLSEEKQTSCDRHSPARIMSAHPAHRKVRAS